MSARVFNPVMSEMSRMLRSGATTTGSSAFGTEQPLLRPEAVARVRRDLFGPVDHEDSRKFVDRELAAQQMRDSDRWGFDFARGSPRKSGPGTSRYRWEKVSPREMVPEPYALRRMAYLGTRAIEEQPTPQTPIATGNNVEEQATNSRCVDGDQGTPTLATTASKAAVATVMPAAGSAANEQSTLNNHNHHKQQQTRMTDFLKSRKRGFNPKMKLSSSPTLPPVTEPKRTRLSNS